MKLPSFSVTAVTSSFLASLCCTGPAVAAMLGTGTLGFLAVLEPYRPYLTAVSVALIGAAIVFAYRKRPQACADGTCPAEPGRKRKLLGVWIVSFIAVLLLAFPYVTFSQDPRPLPAASVISVEGMTCASCERHVESVIGKLDGVSAVHASVSKENVQVVFDSTKIRLETVIDAVNTQTHYTASRRRE